jgi:serine/threonine protein kinase
MGQLLPNIPGYVVQAELGRGGMGVVYRVQRNATGATLALKMILCSQKAAFEELVRFRVEAEAMACLNHPNIVKIRDVGVFAGFPFVALEFAEKGSLRQFAQSKPQPSRWAADLVRVLAEAMEHAHGRGMLHRDLKPANVLVMGDGTPKISDFGLVKFAAPIAKVSQACCTVQLSSLDDELAARFARELRSQYPQPSGPQTSGENDIVRSVWQQCAERTGLLPETTEPAAIKEFLGAAKKLPQARQPYGLPSLDDLTRVGSVMGSPQYMAPEQTGDLHLLGPATDVYGLGGILYELLTGQPPFRAATVSQLLVQITSSPPTPPRQLQPHVPAALEAICLKCLEKSPERRFRHARTLAESLSNFVGAARSSTGEDLPTRADAPALLLPRGDSAAEEAHISASGSHATTRSWWPFGKKKANG